MTPPLDTAPITRRALLLASAGAAAAAALSTPGRAFAARRRSKRPSYLKRSSYRNLVGERFDAVGFGNATAALLLVAARDLEWPRHPDATVRERSFALILEGPAQPVLDTDVYTLRQRSLGTFRVLIGPSAPVGTGAPTQYSIVFNNAPRSKLKPQHRPRKPRPRVSDESRRRRRAKAARHYKHAKPQAAPTPKPKTAADAAPADYGIPTP
jgi:hypothetical protein